MTFSAIRLTFFTSLPRRTGPKDTDETVDHADLRREYVERLLSSDGCVSEYSMSALMGLFPKDF
ncbi:hypothetical protein ACOXXX_08370 [Thalassococcus sp. BH17M4-6]|uniref:hypothetical protein n=1 Tax=Thalassococcus sp. BH17M4-6 TaxID=3413148 RepID=UPI003BE706E1